MPAQSPEKSCDIRLCGQKIPLKARETDPALTREVIELVSSKIKTAEKRAKSAAPHLVALLALMDIAEEYINAKHRTAAFKREMNDRSDTLMRLLESELGA